MNYLTELLAFYKWLETTPLSPLLQAYWHLLMYTNNKAAVQTEDGRWHWPVNFNLPNTTVMKALGLKDRREVVRQRSYLCRHHLVDYEKDKKGRAGKYTMIPFDKGLGRLTLEDPDTQKCDIVWDIPAPKGATKLPPYINHINNKHTSLSYSNQEDAPFMPQFNLLPQISEEEKAAIRAQYPDDDVAAFNAIWAAREEKQKKLKVEGEKWKV